LHPPRRPQRDESYRKDQQAKVRDALLATLQRARSFAPRIQPALVFIFG